MRKSNKALECPSAERVSSIQGPCFSCPLCFFNLATEDTFLATEFVWLQKVHYERLAKSMCIQGPVPHCTCFYFGYRVCLATENHFLATEFVWLQNISFWLQSLSGYRKSISGYRLFWLQKISFCLQTLSGCRRSGILKINFW